METKTKKTVFNLEALVCVEIVDKQRCHYLEHKPFKKSFWGNTKEGFYDTCSLTTSCYSKEEIENGKFLKVKLQVVGETVFYHPYVRLSFAGGKQTVKEFGTYEQALEWGNEMCDKGMDVKLEIR